MSFTAGSAHCDGVFSTLEITEAFTEGSAQPLNPRPEVFTLMPKKSLYTARAEVIGGRDGHGRTDDGQLEVDLRRPLEMGGEGGGTNPEQLFAIGYAACFEGALGTVARRAHLDAGDAEIHSEVSLTTNDDRGFNIGVSLAVTLPSVADTATAVELVTAAHAVCPYSNATRGNIDITLSANGEQISLSE